jgi:hypothetical protein
MGLPQEIERLEGPDGVRYRLPPRPLGPHRLLGCMPLAFGVVFSGLGLVWIVAAAVMATNEPGGGSLLFPLFGVPFVLVGFVPIALGAFVLAGRTEIAVADGQLSTSQRAGPLRWSKARPAGKLIGMRVDLPRVRPQTAASADLAILRADFAGAPPLALAVAYPEAWLAALAADLAARRELTSGRDGPIPVRSPDAAWPADAGAHPAPDGGDVRPPARLLDLAPPPRSVSGALRLRLLFGGALNVVGWAVVCFGMVFVGVFVGNSELRSARAFSGELRVATGSVQNVEQTAFQENDVSVEAVRYGFDADGGSFVGTSYTTATAPAVGARVDVEFVADDPRTSRIKGMRTAPFSAAVVLVWVFPLIGAGLVAFGLRGGRQRLRLLREGQLAYGRLVARERTRTEVNDRPVYRLTFEFQDALGETRRTVARTHRVEDLDDEATEPLLYDPHTGEAVMLDALPGQPVVDAGGFATQSRAVTVAVLILPALTVIAGLVQLLAS